MSKCIVVGVTGCVGAFKSVQLVSDLVKKGYDVEVIMTKNATEFIQPLQFESLTQHKVMVDTFDRNFEYSTQHISISKKADLFIVTPATANFIAKAVHGLADDMLSTTFLACDCPKIIAPAMNTKMYLNPITQNNLKLCEQYGFRILSPVSGHLACGDAGMGKLAGLNEHMDLIEEMLVTEKPLIGKKVLINAGPTLERIDPVRYISNHSSGKMGISLAKAARSMGADVTLVCGPIQLSVPTNIKRIDIESANDMFNAMTSNYEMYDYVICAAAIADYTPATVANHKIKKKDDDLSIPLSRTQDILKYLGEHKTHQKLCGFAMETENEIANGKDKLLRKNCDMLVVNSLNTAGAGFKHDTNVATILTKEKQIDYDLMSKDELAIHILNHLMEV